MSDLYVMRFQFMTSPYFGGKHPAVELLAGRAEDHEADLAKHDRLEQPIFFALVEWAGPAGHGFPSKIHEIQRCTRCGRYQRPWNPPEPQHAWAPPGTEATYESCPPTPKGAS